MCKSRPSFSFLFPISLRGGWKQIQCKNRHAPYKEAGCNSCLPFLSCAPSLISSEVKCKIGLAVATMHLNADKGHLLHLNLLWSLWVQAFDNLPTFE